MFSFVARGLKTRTDVCEVNGSKLRACCLRIIRNVCHYLIVIQREVSLVVRVLAYLVEMVGFLAPGPNNPSDCP